jgi:L-malate glycosyltransferase
VRIAVLDINYPSDTNLYGDVFVHARVQGYVSRGHVVKVIAFFTREASYSFEGVAVISVSNLEELRSAIDDFAPDTIAIHIFQGWMLRKVVMRTTIPVVVWVHGREALGWYRRPFDLRVNREAVRHIAENVLQLCRMHQLYRYIATHRKRSAVVFVSEWLRRAAAQDALTSIQTGEVIPNPIDPGLFSYHRKADECRTKVLLIRSFDSRIYANDIAVKAILALRERPEFSEFKFTIVGSGKHFTQLTAPLRSLPNVRLVETFLTRDAIRELHLAHGVFLSPARQDTQGVSRCEAMASGLVPITSRNSAIPEFVNEETGYLCDGPIEMRNAMLELRNSPERFQRMSFAAAASIATKAGKDKVILQELALMQRLASSR